VFRILATEAARSPSEVAAFIDDYGHAPFFVRWGDGPAELLEEHGDVKKGIVQFAIGGDGKGTMKDGKQKCWLQYSDKMYERGIDIKLEPSGAAEFAKVEGLERTIEVVWTGEVKKGAKLSLSQGKGAGADDVTVAGKWLDQTVQMEAGAGVG
jgi:hypothetical protein